MSKNRRNFDRNSRNNTPENTIWESRNLGHGTLLHSKNQYLFQAYGSDQAIFEKGDYMMVTTDGIGIGIIVVRDGLKILPNPRQGEYMVNGTMLRLSHGVNENEFKLTYTDRTLTNFCITTNEGESKCFSVKDCTPVLLQHIDNTIYVWVPESCA